MSTTDLSENEFESLPFDPFAVDALEDDQLDELAHGVIALDRDGRILRYNLAEANLARLDRHTVIGRNFWTEVAPCTRTPEFEGRFLELVRGSATQVDPFSYLLDFKFGAQQVDVRMVRAPAAERFYIFISRRFFREARSGLQPGWAAPLQTELSRGERGVLRNQAQQRGLRIDVDFLSTLFTEVDKLAGSAWPQWIHAWGVRWGRRFIVTLELEAAQRSLGTLRELPLRTTAALLQSKLGAEGWGEFALDLACAERGLIQIRIEQSAIAELETIGRSRGKGTALLAGLFSAVFSYLADKQLSAVELPGEDRTTNLVIVAQWRVPVVSAAVGRGLRELPALAQALAEHDAGITP